MTVKSVYTVTGKSIDEKNYASGISDSAHKNLGKVIPKDERLQTPEGKKLIGPIWRKDTRFTYVFSWGVPVEDTFMPDEYVLKGPSRPIADYHMMWDCALVSEKFKDIVESFEPGVHQFFPATLFWRRGRPADGKFYFFNVCTNLDSVHAAKSKMPPRETVFAPAYDMEVIKPWDINRDEPIRNQVVFDRAKIGKHHLWRDGYLLTWGLNCTDVFMNACIDANILGMNFNGNYDAA